MTDIYDGDLSKFEFKVDISDISNSKLSEIFLDCPKPMSLTQFYDVMWSFLDSNGGIIRPSWDDEAISHSPDIQEIATAVQKQYEELIGHQVAVDNLVKTKE